ncbi:ABC transporter ATP-binding protein [Colwellia echini]|uniref:ABC transporter ATP-binding protein n=1 Tax=Colwellia echini TaxID=1982103 RepID=A0ABY3MXZ2_9GAMM|nr:ABC transporter ATP-binding protein [Colwellia echini]TYK65872.1 ABC transporter ATP-binding protein [Colwellia echini]
MTSLVTSTQDDTSILLTIEKLSIKLQDKVILSSLDLRLNEGDILGLVGASGCGKTTLLNTIAGFVKVNEGTITLDGRILNSKLANNKDEINLPAEQRQVGMIFQDYALFPHLTVKENIAFGIAKLSKAKQTQQIDQLLHILKLTDYRDSYIHQLSGGQQQRVAIARALAPKPKLLLLDEPFSNIDARLRNELMVEIRLLLKEFKTTAIFVTHNKDEVFTFADKMAVMSQGQLLQFDQPSIVCQQPNSYQVADFLQLGSWLPCAVTTSLNTILATSLLGEFELASESAAAQQALTYLLVKPSQLILTTDLAENIIANAQVEYISMTEQGYHYHLQSLDTLPTDPPTQASHLAFTKLSLYSDNILNLKQKVRLDIKQENLLFFNKSMA